MSAVKMQYYTTRRVKKKKNITVDSDYVVFTKARMKKRKKICFKHS